MIRRSVIFVCVLLTLGLPPASVSSSNEPANTPHFQSAFLRVELAADQPAFTALTVDSLGTKKLGKNPLRPPGKPGQKYELRRVGGNSNIGPLARPPARRFGHSNSPTVTCICIPPILPAMPRLHFYSISIPT